MKSWRKVWRDGFASLISIAGLQALWTALAKDDPLLLQGTTMRPVPVDGVQDWPVGAACALCYCGWKGEGRETVGDVEDYFARLCFEADQRLGEPAACRWFLNWFDDTPRDEMRRLLVAEVDSALAGRLASNRELGESTKGENAAA